MTKLPLVSSRFQAIDQIIIQHKITPLSLNPHKNIITSFRDIGNIIAERTDDTQLVQCLFTTVERIIHAQVCNFPENIFWDYDFIVYSMFEQAVSAKEGAIRYLEVFGNKVVELMSMCGCSSEIRFPYLHDFIYGFDWARWVQKDPVNRANIQPFSLTFLDCLHNKGKELLHKISIDDERYHHISTRSYRNPFCFSRDPKDEYKLLTYLAEYQLIPVSAWNWNATTIWDKPFDQLREQVSLTLFNRTQK
ncbi:hypothetical protein DSM106972_053560 [Dulcicalothrix desertica PCC 7102]|uniref:Ferrochelatase n=1 Tax=Dulcicalothrix desertica PCC 7102 TaxID=232991 RepID=A0A3S1C9T3_9CYAN|nr:hypothetical protein [Dulcicalothrix desertica]RUT03048.1 hypothetical protein DSM106972_053560 [Dulcicalothrix desertica PCC 7102]TWH53423.1 hypothetical protein CAL7102_01376 [Dulcicalothrix desertica PCC 7102]